MDAITIKPVIAEVSYEGVFSALHFGPLAAPIPAYQTLINNHSVDGVAIDTLRIETGSISSANINSALPARNAHFRLQVDRFGVAFQRLSDIGMAADVLSRLWATVRGIDGTIALRQHTITSTTYASIEGASYRVLIQRYLDKDIGLPLASAVFELPADADAGVSGGTLTIDRLPTLPDFVALRTNVAFDATKIALPGLRTAFEALLMSRLTSLGLVLPPMQAPQADTPPA